MSKIKIKNDDKLIPGSISSGEIEDLVIVSNTEPVGEKRRKIWIKGQKVYILNNDVYTEDVTETTEAVYFSGRVRVYKCGKVVNIVAAQAHTDELIAWTLPSGFRPAHQIMDLIIYQSQGWSTLLGRVTLALTGAFTISKANSLPATFENATDGYVSFNLTYLIK